MAAPGRGVLPHPRVVDLGAAGRGLQSGGGIVAARGLVESVHAPRHPDDPPASRLVAEGVAQRLHRMWGVDQVAVVAEPGVDLAERRLAVATEDRSRCEAEGVARQRTGVRVGRRDRGLADGRRAAPLAVGDDRPQLLSQRVDVFEAVEPLAPEACDRPVDVGHPAEVVVALRVELQAQRARDARPPAVLGKPAAGDHRPSPRRPAPPLRGRAGWVLAAPVVGWPEP